MTNKNYIIHEKKNYKKRNAKEEKSFKTPSKNTREEVFNANNGGVNKKVIISYI